MALRRWLPPVTAAATAALGATNLTTLPTGVALLVLSAYLARRRRRAPALGVGLLGATGLLELIRDADPTAAIISLAIAVALGLGRRAFTVRHDRPTRRFALGCAAGFGLAVAAPLVLASWPLPATLASLAGTMAGAWVLFRPLRLPAHRPTAAVQRRVRRIVQEHGADSLSAFKLRPDLRRFMSADGRAFCAYRVKHGVLLIAGDPVGPADALPGLLEQLTAFAGVRGLRLGAVGASEAFRDLTAGAGLASLYLGDEALVGTASFSLEGRAIKKVRQAVNRVARVGYTATVTEVGDLVPGELDELEAVSRRWRQGASERGFSMAMDGLRGEHLADSIVVIARDAAGAARGYLHFVRSYGRPLLSLGAMRRDRDTPNGLTEFLIVAAIERLGAAGTEELSLNFAAFARWLHAPAGPLERVMGAVVRCGNPFFQIESLYRFNAKFGPRWQPRYLLFADWASLPRTALATMQIEGQLPDTRLPAFARRPVPAS